MWDRARRRLAEAQQLRERKLNALNAEVARLAALKDYGKLRLVYQEVMELVDVGSVPYDKARRGLFAVDNALRGKTEMKRMMNFFLPAVLAAVLSLPGRMRQKRAARRGGEHHRAGRAVGGLRQTGVYEAAV